MEATEVKLFHGVDGAGFHAAVQDRETLPKNPKETRAWARSATSLPGRRKAPATGPPPNRERRPEEGVTAAVAAEQMGPRVRTRHLRG